MFSGQMTDRSPANWAPDLYCCAYRERPPRVNRAGNVGADFADICRLTRTLPQSVIVTRWKKREAGAVSNGQF